MLHSHMLYCIAAYAASNTTTCPSGGEPGDLHDCCISADMDRGGEKEEMGWLKERGWKWEQSGEGREGGERRRKREQHRLEMWVMVRVIRQSLLEDVRSVVLGCSHEKGTEIVVLRIKKEGWERSSDPGFFLTSTQLTTEWTSDLESYRNGLTRPPLNLKWERWAREVSAIWAIQPSNKHFWWSILTPYEGGKVREGKTC